MAIIYKFGRKKRARPPIWLRFDKHLKMGPLRPACPALRPFVAVHALIIRLDGTEAVVSGGICEKAVPGRLSVSVMDG